MRFAKGHGTENDFVLLPDPDDRLELTDALVSRLCDRRAGLGADGVLRVVRMGSDWFMDHRNADGSRPEMCGNGIRVYARYLVANGWEAAGPVRIGTRSGLRTVEVDDEQVVVDMGAAELGPPVLVDGDKAVGVGMGNPHAVLFVDSVDALGVLGPDRRDLNVEYVEVRGERELRMRVHERGVGETRSCGTGACAAAVAHSLATGLARDIPIEVRVPGGRLVLTWRADGHVLMAGPAVLVAAGELTPEWLAG